MNTFNLISAISVLACNVSMANIPKQANSNDYGDISVITRSITYNTANSLQSDNNLTGTNRIIYSVSRQIGNYSDERINFYTERYVFSSSWADNGELIKIGFVYFFTLDIYTNTLLTEFLYTPKLSSSSNVNISGTYFEKYYNLPLSINNVSNTLYFQNYNLGWDSNTNLPKVASANESYVPLSHSGSIPNKSGTINSIFDPGLLRFNNDNSHGSINYSHVHYLDLTSTLNDSGIGFNPNGGSFTYKFYINNPTYEVIDLPNVMLSILTMPFTFFSQAFNLTLFPNTPYALNIGHTILIIVGVIGTIYLIRYLVSIFKG